MNEQEEKKKGLTVLQLVLLITGIKAVLFVGLYLVGRNLRNVS